MSEALYLNDAYLAVFTAHVTQRTQRGVILDRTTFYPGGGGQPSDIGVLRGVGREVWQVNGAEKSPDGIVHLISEEAGPPAGSVVHGEIDWNRRFLHMRYHTSLHILSGVVFRQFGSGITGGQIYESRARMDFSLPNFNRELAEGLLGEANRVVQRNIPIHVRFISRVQAETDPTLVRVASELMPQVETVRLIDIEGFDVQADGGTHVGSTGEVGCILLEKIENKGARNKRLHLALGPASQLQPRAAPSG